MTRPLTAFQPIRGEAAQLRARFLSDPVEWLPGEARSVGPESWLVSLGFAGLSRTVRCQIGAPWHATETVWRTMRWVPEPEPGDVAPLERLLPSLDAELGLTIHDGSASLALTGHYDVPGSPVGELADAMLLHRVARRTALEFLAAVAGSLGRTVSAAT